MPEYRVKCRTLSLTLDELGRPVSLKLAPAGYEFLAAAPGGPPTGLWQLGLIRPVHYHDPLPPIHIPKLDYEGQEWWANRHEYRADLALDAADAPPPAITGDADGLTLTWSIPIPAEPHDPATAGHHTAPSPTATQPVRFTLRILGGAEREQLEFRASVTLPKSWALKRVTFPRLRGFGDLSAPHADALLYPENWGVLRHNPLEDMTGFTGQYPSGSNWCQMTAWLHGTSGLYLGILDPDTHHTGIDAQYVEGDRPAPWEIERWHIRPAGAAAPANHGGTLADRLQAGVKPAMQFRCNHWPTMADRWECPYPVVLRGFTGTWFDAARIHRDWATKQRWCRRGRLADRADASPALASIDLWFTRYGFHPASLEPKPAWEFQRAMHALHEFFAMPFGVHWYHWHNFSWHRQFPNHTPVVEGFEQVKRDLQSRGIVVMPYCQGRMLYQDRVGIETERSHASVEANGQPYLELYTPEDPWPLALCPGDKWSQMQWHEAARMLWRHYGVDGVYFDQITAMPPSLCYHAGHGHALGGGTQYWQGYDQVLAAMEPLVAENPRRFLSSECLADAFMDRIDLYLAFVPPLEDYVPLFSAIYGGYTTAMGRATPGQVMAEAQLFAMAQGEQLLFGGQLGWMNEAILQHAHAAKYLRDLAQLRARLRPFLHLGQMEAPLEDVCPGSKVLITLPPGLCGKARPVRIERQAVMNTVWLGPAPGGRRVVLLLNEGVAPVTAIVRPRPEWHQGTWRMWVLGEDAGTDVTLGEEFRVPVPALGVVALESMNG